MLHIETLREKVLLRPGGEWDSSVEMELKSRILGKMSEGYRDFVIDLSELGHIKYSILPDLLSFYRQIRRQGAELALASPSSYLLSILAAGDLAGQVPIYPSEACAGPDDWSSSAAMVHWQEGEREESGLGL
ncbi:MAG: STAS domain-containing protein [Candidatus Krumholzibacteria bacterium]|jgi:anti-anti-sigma factor|nr:STAS domain-containing protein [Candidatus Krumholzibacteria bacterium]MDP6669428.1 STAS domain-containing protein [Candidatus Krumholzibacteria bacterium]MDP6796897.1 STAS domain-containing protein [Candidatus Krumholzibacteria bacterium]MDP7021625.1 STAS domain-containing protein [Candidatus Krumholzibacteria bacterium]